jgi:hypothetical protein
MIYVNYFKIKETNALILEYFYTWILWYLNTLSTNGLPKVFNVISLRPLSLLYYHMKFF